MVCLIKTDNFAYSIYFIILSVADFVYGKNFILKELLWHNHGFCILGYCLNLTYILTLPYLLFFMSLTRLMVVLYSLQSKFKSKRFANKNILLTLTTLAIVSFLLSLNIISQGIASSLCSPFMDPTDTILQTKLIIIITSTFHSLLLGLILIMIIMLIRYVQHSSDTLGCSVSSQKSTKAMHIQLTVMFLVNFFCWIHADIAYMAALIYQNILWKVFIGQLYW